MTPPLLWILICLPREMKEKVSIPRAAVSGCLAQWPRHALHTGKGYGGMLFWGGRVAVMEAKLGGRGVPRCAHRHRTDVGVERSTSAA